MGVRYISTRGGAEPVDFAEATLAGIAPDGGLYVPDVWPTPDLAPARTAGLAYADLAQKVLTAFVGDALPDAALAAAARRVQDGFHHAAVTPLVQLAPNLWVLELFHGPTAAFKDLAMQMAASLSDAALSRTGEKLTLLTATSGDTGAAAVRAFAGADNIRLVVLHPLDRVSPVQRRQMTTVDAPNVLNLAVRGDFDDCQRLVKALLADPRLRNRGRLSSVNSINWARLAGQVPYWVAAASALGGSRPRFVVPTGNFGDAFAGWAARRMGADVGPILAAVNRNDALARALNEGVYERRSATPTASVSMDVQAPSNFERLVFEASGRDADRTRDLFATFEREGRVELGADLRARLTAEVSATSIDEAETRAEIRRTFDECGRVICPHTAVALAAARRMDTGAGPVVALSTAHPAKFPDVIRETLGFDPEQPPALRGLEGLPERLTVVDADLEAVIAEIA